MENAPEKSIGDELFEKNLADLNKEMEGDPEYLFTQTKEIAQLLKDRGIEFSPEFHGAGAMGAQILGQLVVQNAETRTVRQLLEKILRRLEEKPQ